MKIEPMLHFLMQSAEIDLFLATAKLLEPPRRSKRSLFAFLEFCISNRENICWKAGAPPIEVLQYQKNSLESHRNAIDMIKSRRDKFFAHLDSEYFDDPRAIYKDFPLVETDLIALVNCVIAIIVKHQSSLGGPVNFHLAQFFRIAIDNMVRNLEAGRRINFPGQLD